MGIVALVNLLCYCNGQIGHALTRNVNFRMSLAVVVNDMDANANRLRPYGGMISATTLYDRILYSHEVPEHVAYSALSSRGLAFSCNGCKDQCSSCLVSGDSVLPRNRTRY